MKLLDRHGRVLTPTRPRRVREYESAKSSRLTNDWVRSNLTADAEIYRSIVRLVDRSREMERNNDWMRGVYRSLENNVIGHAGIALQMKISDQDETPDTFANKAIEDGWKDWGLEENCTLSADFTWLGLQQLMLRSVARDGNVFIRKVRGNSARNSYKYALQLWEFDWLDIDYNSQLANGNTVTMGVEKDANRRRVAYWFRSSHPGAFFENQSLRRSERMRFPASDMIHLFIAERPGQTLGVPWYTSCMKNLHMLGGYQEAELVASRVAASKMGFFTREYPEDYTPGEEDEQGNRTMDAEPGTMEELPPGMKFETWDPQHPAGSYGPFVKQSLRGVAAGTGVAYHSLAHDLEGVNYSSARVGMLEEREMWKMLQTWFISKTCKPIFREWLEMALLTNALRLPATKFDKFHKPTWKGRRWDWVDPAKDIAAKEKALALGLTSKRAVIGENGRDIEEVFDEIALDDKLEAKKGVKLTPAGTPKPTISPARKEDEEDEE